LQQKSGKYRQADSQTATGVRGNAAATVRRQSIASSEGLQEYPPWWARRIIGRSGRGSGSTTSSLWTILSG